jgi:hypothetical protein
LTRFSIIEGGGRGPPDRSSGRARYHLRQAIIDILRSVVRGYDAEARLTNHLTEFYREIVEAELDPQRVVSDVLYEAHKDLDHNLDRDSYQDQWEPIVLRALQVAAETLADDPGAKGRASKMQSHLGSAIDHRALRHEMRRKTVNRSKPKKNFVGNAKQRKSHGS